ncbi:hypothetical protein QDA04_gp15 [Microbacterium phage Megan]|uniref:Uncharacterized protein n=1 Tax=Microbacterium phage Megan TaxID=2656551 RepID=A0A649VKH2_9CAUD|nr:hypothetical protein QDA04_gp15 [Microbacterium phage Megan]QGJ92761.1 hypothetical protein PBI_MEGAN_15 [Microbacterium phage Megan]
MAEVPYFRPDDIEALIEARHLEDDDD